MVQVNFLARSHKLEVNLRDLSSAPSGSIYKWDFGDGSPFSSERNPSHTYEKTGIYSVTLSIMDVSQSTLGTLTRDVLVSEYVQTVLPDSIYKLIDTYLPSEVFGEISMALKQQLISKWQIYLGDIVNHNIPPHEKDNELYYEALENQLIMELVAYDYTVMNVTRLVGGSYKATSGKHVQVDGDGNEVDGGDVKKIITGPTEVEYFDSGNTKADLIRYAYDALKPGGLIDTLKKGICMLADRLDIYLPFCNLRDKNTIVPRVVDRRHPKPLSGPDPYGVLRS